MRSWLVLGLFLVGVFGTGGATGCYSEYEVRPAHCQAVWVPAHRSWGRWHHGHWRCM